MPLRCRCRQLDSTSRFGRDNVEVIEALRLLKELGIKVYFMEEGIDIDAVYDEFELTVLAAINQSENEHRSKNIKMGLRFCAERGSSGLYKKPCFGTEKTRMAI